MKEASLSLPLGTVKFLLWPGPRTVFEIGACIGEHTVPYASAFLRAKIHAFEPLPENYSMLRKFSGSCDRIETHELALGDARGEATFHVSSGTPTPEESREAGDFSVSRSSSLLAPAKTRPGALQWLEFGQSIRVATDTLDNFCAERGIQQIDFIHMDVQGAELKVLAGAKRMLPRIRAIWMEVTFESTYEGQPLETETTRWMAQHGFRKIHQVSNGPEGDALYYNMRLPLSWPRFVALRVMQKIGVVAR